MLRIRTKRLLSGVSAIAVIASVGMLSPVMAAPTYSGPLTFPPITNDQSGAGATVTIDLDATVDKNTGTNASNTTASTNGDSFFNGLTMTGAGVKLTIDDSFLLGDIENVGTMQSSDSNGISILNDSQVGGRLFNSGLIEGSAGLFLRDDSTIGSGIFNLGTIQGITGDAINVGNDSEVFGGIYNSGLISGFSDGIDIDDADVDFFGGITNTSTGTIQAAGGAAIEYAGNSFTGGLQNSGLITGITGISILSGTFGGGITNNVGGTIIGTVDAAVEITGGVFDDGIDNSSLIHGAGGANAFEMSGGTFNGGIINNSTGIIQADSSATAIAISGGTFNGGITNSGRILANIGTGIGINVSGTAVFTGGITNNSGGSIFATDSGTAILIQNTTFSGGITNAGSINANQDAIRITATAFSGGVNNSGSITSFTGNALEFSGAGTFTGDVTNQAGALMRAGRDAVTIGGASFTGNFVNSGIVDVTFAGTGVEILSTTFTGGFTNNATGSIDGTNDGVRVNVTTHTGAFTNNGSINGAFGDGVDYTAGTHTGGDFTNGGFINGAAGDGVRIDGTAFAGNFSNTGTIQGTDNGVQFTGTTFTGNVVNNGVMTGAQDALRVDSGTTITGSVTNSSSAGLITSTAEDGVDINGIVSGGFDNQGTIDGFRDGIDVDGTVASIANSGTILGRNEAAIDISGADAATTITQSAGLIRGRTNGGTIILALDLDNGFADTFNGTGGVLDGNVDGNGSDAFNVTTSTTFAHLRGTTTDLSSITMSGLGDFLMGAASRGDTTGEGVTVNTTTNMSLTGDGRVYVDDNTTVNLTNAYSQGGEGILEFYLTSDTTTHGQINAGGEGLFLDGRIAAFVNGTSFGSVGGDTFTYQDVMTGGVSGTFTNAGDIITNSLFFTGVADVNAADVDIILTRESFFDALVLPGQTSNENAIGNALDDIYALGPANYGADMEAIFNYLLSLGAGDEELALAVYNEISGAEHAQLQQTTLDLLNPFGSFMGQRLDQAKTSQSGVGFAQNGGLRLAQNTSIMSDASQGMTRGQSGVSLWARGYGQTVNVDGDPEAPGYHQDTGGVAGGIDFAIGGNGIIGAAIGWSSTDVDFATPGDSADVDSMQIGAYGSYGFGRFYLDGQLAGAFHDLSTSRFLNLPNPPGGSVAGANYDARSISASGEFGAVWRSGNWLFQPNAGLLFTDVNTDSFIESGGGDFNLIVDESDATSFASSLGARVATQFKAGGMNIMPEISAAWRHEFDDDRQSFTAAFPDDPSSTFNIISSKISADSALVEAGVAAGVTDNVELFLNYDGLLNSGVDVHNGSAGLRATW